MRETLMYQCDYCGQEFGSREECEAHEETHLINYSEKDNATISKELRDLSEHAHCYHIRYEVCGMPLYNFESLMEAAADRVEGKE